MRSCGPILQDFLPITYTPAVDVVTSDKMAAPMKRKRVSKKSKRSWRKHSDIKDVEEYLEEERLLERTGGHPRKKANENLFFIDDIKLSEQCSASYKEKPRADIRSIKLHCHQNLEPDTKFKPISKRRSEKVRRFEKKPLDLQKRVTSNLLTASKKNAETKSRVARQAKADLKKKKSILPVANYDLWSGGVVSGTGTTKSASSLKAKSSSLPAIEVCHPGASYNPEYEDHQNLMIAAAAVEMKKISVEERVLRQTAKPRDIATEESRLNEMSEGLFTAHENDEEEVMEESDDMVRTAVSRVKTKKQRRKEKEQRVKKTQRRLAKADKARTSQFYRLRSIKSEIKKGEVEAASKVEAMKKRRAAKKTQRLNNIKYEDPDLEVSLPEELSGSLRTLNVQGNLLTDRYKSLQKRNIVEPRQLALHKRKYKLKYVSKRGKDLTDDV